MLAGVSGWSQPTIVTARSRLEFPLWTSSITPVARVASIVLQSKDEQTLSIPRVKDRVGEFRYAATSDACFNTPEAFGITANLSDGRLDCMRKSLRCSPVETNGFEVFVSRVLVET